MQLFIIFVLNLLLCVTNGDENTCYCLPKEKCLDNGPTVVNLQDIVDIRMDHGKCENAFDVCCKNPSFLNSGTVDAELDIKETFAGTCGYQNDIYGSRIIGESQEANFGEIPWMVAILFNEDSKSIYKCGGSLIHPQVVLTAAHCVENVYAQWIVRAGETDTKNDQEPLPYQQRIVNTIISHPEYNRGPLVNDIALLVLESSLELADNVGTVCLPARDEQWEQGNCLASGWGKDALKKGKHSSILKVVQLPMVPRDVCQNSLRNTRLGHFFRLHESFVCAGGEANKDTCKGDGGSPLVCRTHDKIGTYTQVGIVSWGVGCGEKDTPGVYTNLAMYRHWIDEQFNSFGLDSGSYAK